MFPSHLLSTVDKPMRYVLVVEHNPAVLVEKVNAELAQGAVFCGGPQCRPGGEIIQAVVYPETRKAPDPQLCAGGCPASPLSDQTFDSNPSNPPPPLPDPKPADREGLNADTYIEEGLRGS